MPLVTPQIVERRKSRSFTLTRDGTSSAGKMLFFVVGTWNEEVVEALCEAELPPTFKGMFLQKYDVEPQGGGYWYVEASYGVKEPKASVYSFETTTQTTHVTVSKETMASGSVRGDEEEAPDYGGAIGVAEDKVNGTDILVPTFAFTETHYIPAELITGAYKVLLFQLTAQTNELSWKGFAPGEVLFLGAQGSLKDKEDWEISFKFACSPNLEDLPIPGEEEEVIPFKQGWWYLWYSFAQKKDPDAPKVVVTPDFWYLERLYDPGDLSQLGIGM